MKHNSMVFISCILFLTAMSKQNIEEIVEGDFIAVTKRFGRLPQFKSPSFEDNGNDERAAKAYRFIKKRPDLRDYIVKKLKIKRVLSEDRNTLDRELQEILGELGEEKDGVGVVSQVVYLAGYHIIFEHGWDAYVDLRKNESTITLEGFFDTLPE